jgi:DNA-directed RNA polymerase specialized sigma subunit
MTERERILANMTVADRINFSPLSEARARVVKDIETKLGRALTDAEIAERLKINLNVVQQTKTSMVWLARLLG